MVTKKAFDIMGYKVIFQIIWSEFSIYEVISFTNLIGQMLNIQVRISSHNAAKLQFLKIFLSVCVFVQYF